MQVYSKTDARQNFASLFNAVRYANQVVGVGRGKIRDEQGNPYPEVLMVKMPSQEEYDRFRNSPLGFERAMQKWLLQKIADEFSVK